ncbi:hypothetical protein SNEBB_006397 [Seison nebaliae]|nr:hypothetical protein SNEBB_006397 [Seison nebaliae]
MQDDTKFSFIKNVREALPNIISFQLPYWIIVNPFWSKVFSQSEKKMITNFNSTDYELNENMIMRKLSTITIGQRNIQTGFDENSRLENLPIFSKTMGDDEPYDVTGIIYALYSSRKNLDIRQSLSDEFNPEERQMENIQSCRKEIMENFSEVKDLITDETFKMKLDEIYPLVESIIKKLMEAYCAHVLGYYKITVVGFM